MSTSVRVRFWVETGLAGLAAVLGGLTLLWPDWIEEVFGIDPDGGSGLVEWLVVMVLAATAVNLGLLARAERRRSVAHQRQE